MRYLLFFFILFLSSCTPATRLANLLKHNPELRNTKVQADTLTFFHTDTFTTHETRIDTLFNFLHDTVLKYAKDNALLTVTKKKNDVLLNLVVKSDTFYSHDTFKLAYLDTLWQVQYIPIDTAAKWQYRKDGMLILGAVLLLLLLLSLIAKNFIK